jgi:tether containing UBX domain for GLUT4
VPHPEGKDIPGGRLIKKFPSDLTLWQVLRQFESGDASQGRNLNITARGVAQLAGDGKTGGGQLLYETPVLNIMGRELASFPDFQKTLSQMGYNSGSVLIRLSYKTTGQTLYEAMEQIGHYFKQEDKEEPNQSKTEDKRQEVEEQPPDRDTVMADAPAEAGGEPGASQPDTAVHQAQEPTVSSGEAHTVVDKAESKASVDDPYQPLNVFLAPTGTAPAAALAPVNEADYTPTVAHAQLHQTRLLENSRNKRLLSDKELEEKAAAEEAKIAAVKSVLIKIRFPDNTSSEWQVGPDETGSFLYEAVRHVMADREQPFHLVLPGNKTVIKDEDSPRHSLVKAYKLSGRVLLNLVWDDSVKPDVRKKPFLKSNVARQGQSIKVPDIPQPSGEEESPAAAPKPPKEEKGSGDGIGKKLPKWFKGLGKK